MAIRRNQIIGFLSVFFACSVGTPPSPSTVEGDAALVNCISQWEDKLSDPSLRKEAISAISEGLSRISDQNKKDAAKKDAAKALQSAYEVNANREEILLTLKELNDLESAFVFRQVIEDYQPGKTDRLVAVAADALGNLQDAQAIDALTSLLKEEIPSFLQMKALRALGTIQDPDKKAYPHLLGVLDRASESQERFLTVLAIGGLGNLRDPRAVPSLVKTLYLRQGERDLAPWVTLALTQIGAPSLDQLVQALNGTFEEINALEKQRIIPPGKRGFLAARAIAELPISVAKKARTPLRKALQQDRGPETPREGAAFALGIIGDPEDAKLLATYLTSGYATRRIAVARSLAMLGNPEILPSLFAMMEDGAHKNKNRVYHHPRWEAARAISLLGTEESLEAYDKIRNKEKDKVSRKYFDEYRNNLLAAKECQDKIPCWKKKLAEKNWIVSEKAAYVLAHKRAKEAVGDLVEVYQSTSSYELRRAILFALRRLGRGASRKKLDTLLQFAKQEESDLEKRNPYQEVIEEPVPPKPGETPKPPIKKFIPKESEYLSGDPITLSDLGWEVRVVIARLDPNYVLPLPTDWDW